MPRRTRCKVRFSRSCGFSNFAWSVTSRSQTLDPGRGLNRPFPMEWKTFYVLRGAGGTIELRHLSCPLSCAPFLLASLICDVNRNLVDRVSIISIDRFADLEKEDLGVWIRGWMEESNEWIVKVWFKSNYNLGIADWIIVMGSEESEEG